MSLSNNPGGVRDYRNYPPVQPIDGGGLEQVTGEPPATPANGIALAEKYPAENIIHNGDFRVWQRGGGGSATLNPWYQADRWFASGHGTMGGLVFTVNKDVQNNKNRCRVNFPSNSSYQWELGQGFDQEDMTPYVGKKLTFSFWVYQSGTVATKVGAIIVGFGSSSLLPDVQDVPVTTWTKYTYTTPTLEATTANPRFYVAIPAGSVKAGNFYVRDVELTCSETYVPTRIKDTGETLRQCQRYYWEGTAPGNGYGNSYGTAGATYMVPWRSSFPVTMRTTPTIGTTTTPTGNNCTFTDTVRTVDGFATRVTVTATGKYSLVTGVYSASAEVYY